MQCQVLLYLHINFGMKYIRNAIVMYVFYIHTTSTPFLVLGFISYFRRIVIKQVTYLMANFDLYIQLILNIEQKNVMKLQQNCLKNIIIFSFLNLQINMKENLIKLLNTTFFAIEPLNGAFTKTLLLFVCQQAASYEPQYICNSLRIPAIYISYISYIFILEL